MVSKFHGDRLREENLLVIELCMDSNGLFENEKKRKETKEGRRGVICTAAIPNQASDRIRS